MDMDTTVELANNGRRATGQRWGEVGTSGIEAMGGWVTKAPYSELHWPGVYPVFERIRRTDPEVSIIRQLFTALAHEVKLEWKVGDNAGDGEKRLAEYLEQVFDDVEGGVSSLVSQILDYVPFMGWGWWEILPGLRRPGWRAPGRDDWRSQYNDDLIGIRRFAFRHHSSFHRWDMDDATGVVYGMEQSDPPSDMVIIPSNRSLHLTFGDSTSPEGLAPLEALHRLERYKFNLEIVQGTGFSHAAGHAIFRHQKTLSTADRGLIKKAALSMFSAREGAYLSLPRHLDAELADSRFSAAESILSAIRHYSMVKLQLYNMQWVAMSTTSGAGSYSSHRDGSSMFVTTFNGMMTGQANQVGAQILRQLARYNPSLFAAADRMPKLTARAIRKHIELGQLSNFVAQVWPMLEIGEEDIIAVREYSGFMPPRIPEKPVDIGEPGAESRRDPQMAEFFDPRQPRGKDGKWTSGGGGRLSKTGREVVTARQEERLREVEKEIIVSRNEVAYLIGDDGSQLIRRVGSSEEVEFDYLDYPKMPGNVLTHNHPGGASFSPNDVVFAARQEIDQIRAVGVSPFDGKNYRYTLSYDLSDEAPTTSAFQMQAWRMGDVESIARASHLNAKLEVRGEWKPRIVDTVDARGKTVSRYFQMEDGRQLTTDQALFIAGHQTMERMVDIAAERGLIVTYSREPMQ